MLTDLRLNQPRYATLPNLMKAKSKLVKKFTLEELNVEIKSDLEIVQVTEPPKRKAGVIVASVDELIDKLKHEANVQVQANDDHKCSYDAEEDFLSRIISNIILIPRIRLERLLCYKFTNPAVPYYLVLFGHCCWTTLLFRTRSLVTAPLFPVCYRFDSISGKKMEFVNRIADIAARIVNNNTVINICLVASFATLGVRSMNQQRTIYALEAEKDSLIKSNKSIRKTLWNWKQQLYAEASTDSAVVPLARLKAIYGEAPPPQHATIGDTLTKDANSPGPTQIIA
ncbi:hypothetical protein VNO78_20084 [Psophocarpus tetragonolobus]|uniref:Uncharacterized protein n=1 Tax=Psophocarpus tetragonolobus TaxID=3891 RepID=A0AAN9S9R4_PSOTE